jgi:hypothetical protein
LSPFVIKLKAEHRWTTRVVEEDGNAQDKETLSRLTGQLERYLESGDQRGLKFVSEQLLNLRAGILHNQPWFWQNHLAIIRQPGRKFLNQAEAQKWLKEAEAANARNDLPALRKAVDEVYKLWPPDQVESAKEQAMQSGLKGV